MSAWGRVFWKFHARIVRRQDSANIEEPDFEGELAGIRELLKMKPNPSSRLDTLRPVARIRLPASGGISWQRVSRSGPHGYTDDPTLDDYVATSDEKSLAVA